jgi:Fe-S-cluster containining protein
MLQEDNTCKVYEDRPLICNIEKFAEYFGLDKGKYYSENIDACEKIMDKHNFPKEKRIWKKN